MSEINRLMELQVRRKDYIRLINMQMNAAAALVRRALGWKSDDENREKVNAKAQRIVAKAFKGDYSDLPGLAVDLEIRRLAIEPLQKARKSIEFEMKNRAVEFPIWEAWGKGIAGFGELGLAVVIGEAGDLSAYDNPAKLWKRFGLAPYNGKACSTWRRNGGLTSEEWTSLGYSPRRRAEIYAVIGDPLFKHSKKTAYRAVYDGRRARTAETHADWTKLHSHNDALRVMTKNFLVDLWSAWRRARKAVQPSEALPDAESPAMDHMKAKRTVPENPLDDQAKGTMTTNDGLPDVETPVANRRLKTNQSLRQEKNSKRARRSVKPSISLPARKRPANKPMKPTTLLPDASNSEPTSKMLKPNVRESVRRPARQVVESTNQLPDASNSKGDIQ